MAKTTRHDERPQGGFLYSIRLTILLLLLLAVLSVIGTLIPQGLSRVEYLQIYQPRTYEIMKTMGVFHVYHSWWFVGVMVLLAVNLTACSWKRLPGLVRQIRTSGRGYARLGTYVTHLSVLVILAAGLIGAVWGFKGYVVITEGETVTAMVQNNPQRTVVPLGFGVRLDTFRVEFYPNGTPKEYESTLTFLQDDTIVRGGVSVRVNHPTTYAGLTFYQASYGVDDDASRAVVQVDRQESGTSAVTLELGRGQAASIPGTDARIGFMKYADGGTAMGEGILTVFFPANAPPQSFWLFSRPGAEAHKVGDYSVRLTEISRRYYTGLQISRDPGLPLFWIGGSLLILGMMVTFLFRRPATLSAEGKVET